MTFEKMMLLAFLAALIAGPKNLPRYAQWFGKTVRTVLSQWQTTKENLKEEAGVDADIDWHQFDPRQYDPRRIIREAISEQATAAPAGGAPHLASAPAAAAVEPPASLGEPAVPLTGPTASRQESPIALPAPTESAAAPSRDAASSTPDIHAADPAARIAAAIKHPSQPVIPPQPQS
jgi:sec-independent protein translocase protein TatB